MIMFKTLISRRPPLFQHGPFTAAIQVRFKKPASTAQTRLESRTLDPKLDALAFQRRRLNLILRLCSHVSAKKRWSFISVQLLSRWATHAGINTLSIADILQKYPHVFEVFTHPVHRNACCKFTPKFSELLVKEAGILYGMVDVNLIKIKKLLSMSVNGRLHLHAIRLMKREFGLPDDFIDAVIKRYDGIFRIVDLEIVELVDWNEGKGNKNFAAEVEKWREKEYTEKWLSEFETKYAFPTHFPTGFEIMPGFRENLRNWQRLSYVKPYERMENVRVGTCRGGAQRYEKRAVAIIHELLCLTVEKTLEVERLAHFKTDFGIKVNICELLLKHPGIFYVSTKGRSKILFLRDAYSGYRLVEPNPLYDVRRNMLGLIVLGCRNTRGLRRPEEANEEEKDATGNENSIGTHDGDFVIPIFESLRL